MFQTLRRTSRVLLPLCALLTAGGWAQAAPARRPPVPAVSATEFPWSRQRRQDRDGYYQQPIGLCEDYPEKDRTQAKLDRDFAAARSAGARVLRVGIPWESIERQPGHYDWAFWDSLVATAVRSRVLLIPYVCYTPQWAASAPTDFWKQPPADPARFGAFMRVIAGRYRGRVRSWELWNEPDNRDFWLGSASQFARMVRAGSDGVRQGAPGAAVVLGGMSDGKSPFLVDLLGPCRVGAFVDVLNFHGYFETWNVRTLEDYTGYIDSVAGRAGRLHPPPDIWLAEFGYSSPRGVNNDAAPEDVPVYFAYQHTTAYQAAALFKSHVLAASTGRLSLTAWYRINDLTPGTDVIGDEQNRTLGVLDLNGRPKPALAALRFYGRLFGPPTRCLDRDVRIEHPPDSMSVMHVFARKPGTVIVTGWLRSLRPGEVKDTSGTLPDTRAEEVALVLPRGTWRHLQTYDVAGNARPSRAVLSGNVLRRVVLTGAMPFIATVTRIGPGRVASARLRPPSAETHR